MQSTTKHAMPYNSNSRFPFYLFGQLAEAEYIAADNTISFRLPQWRETSQAPYNAADFIRLFGPCMLHPDFPEQGTIGEKLSRIHVISQDLHDLYTMGADHLRPDFTVLAEWQENNSHHIRVQDAFGGSYTYRFSQDGRVSRSFKHDWELVAKLEPATANA